jgi:hypothetical protein
MNATKAKVDNIRDSKRFCKSEDFFFGGFFCIFIKQGNVAVPGKHRVKPLMETTPKAFLQSKGNLFLHDPVNSEAPPSNPPCPRVDHDYGSSADGSNESK